MDSGRLCPGARALRESTTPDEHECPRCGVAVALWSDERGRTCPACGALVAKAEATLPECVDWCPDAVACLGDDVLARRRGKLG